MRHTFDFEWDEEKAAKNVLKHGIDFPAATRVFADEFKHVEFDDEHSEHEERWVAIGSVDDLILFVVFTVRDGDVIRIITARKATDDEQKTYCKIQPRRR